MSECVYEKRETMVRSWSREEDSGDVISHQVSEEGARWPDQYFAPANSEAGKYFRRVEG